MNIVKSVFIDSVGWIALMNRNDSLHQETVRAYREIGKVKRITTDAVLIESCNALSKTTLRPLALALMEKVQVSKDLGVLEVTHANEYLIEQGWELFKNRLDKDWSFTDCISFSVMTNKGINTALTSDHHFEQAGYKKLL